MLTAKGRSNQHFTHWKQKCENLLKHNQKYTNNPNSNTCIHTYKYAYVIK